MRIQFTFDGCIGREDVEHEFNYVAENMKHYTDRRCVRADEGGRGFIIECNNLEGAFFAGAVFNHLVKKYHGCVGAERLD